MISRRTIASLLLMLLLAGGLRLWTLGHVDDCDRMATHLGGTPSSVMVDTGSRMSEMPCTLWVPRQPVWVQLLCLLGLALGVVFLLSAVQDWMRTRKRKREQAW